MVMYRLAVTFLVIRESFLTATVEFASKLRATYAVGIQGVGAVGDYPRLEGAPYWARPRLPGAATFGPSNYYPVKVIVS